MCVNETGEFGAGGSNSRSGGAAARPVRLAVVILNYRTPQLVLDCLETLDGQVEPVRDEVVVVDNASEDGSDEAIQAVITARGWGSWARVVAADRNGGFSAGNNAGIRASDAEFYLLLNSDTLVRSGAIAELLRAAEELPGAGLIGPRLEEQDGTGQNSAFRTITPLGQLNSAAKTGLITRLMPGRVVAMPVADKPHGCDWISFACVLVRRAALEAVGPMDEGMFMYFEDADYGLRVRAAGFGVWYWPAARVVHFGGGSGALVSGRRLPKYYYAARARYFVRHFGLAGWVIGNLLWNVGFTVHAVKCLLLRRPIGKDHLAAIDVWTASASTPAGRLSAFAKTETVAAGWLV